MTEIAHSLRGNLIPRFRTLRWIPTQYRRILTLRVMKRYQCLVVGAAQGILTVALADQQDTSVLELLSELTGRAIFPVWVDSVRMHLLIQRIERYERGRTNALGRSYTPIASVLQVRSIVALLARQHRSDR